MKNVVVIQSNWAIITTKQYISGAYKQVVRKLKKATTRSSTFGFSDTQIQR